MRVGIIYGTRPETIKLAPVYLEALKRTNITPILISSGQHQDLHKQAEHYFNITPDIRLDIEAQTGNLADLSSKLLIEFSHTFKIKMLDYVLVQGDTTTAFIASLAGIYAKIPVGHIEAGLRSFDVDNPFPEEFNRILISKMASHHFAPSIRAEKNLHAEGIDAKKILMTGNTVIDAIKYFQSQNTCEDLNYDALTILVTLHRRENIGTRLRRICKAILKIANSYPRYKIILPMHLNPEVRSIIQEILSGQPNVNLIEPVDYPDLLNLIKQSKLIISDSGGIQEEASYFNKPILICRRTTERQELLDIGLGHLVGDDEMQIINQASNWLNTPPTAISEVSPYGYGQASMHILDFIETLI